MKRLIVLFIAVSAFTILSAQTLRMTTVHIDEQKKVVKHNNHIIGGVGFSTIKDYEDDGIVGAFCMAAYYRTDVLLDNKLGFYGLLSYGEISARGVIAGISYKVMDKDLGRRLFITGGIGFGSYLTIVNYPPYEYFDPYFRMEIGALYSHNRFDIRLTTGYPDFLTVGVGFNF